MESRIEKCDAYNKKRVRETMEEIELPNQECVRILRKGKLRILGNIGSGHYQRSRDERKNK